MVRFFYVKYTKNLKFLSGSGGSNGPDLRSPCGRKFQFQFISHLLMMGEASLETSPKNIMIQDMINSDNMNSTELTIPNIFKTIKEQYGALISSFQMQRT